MLADLQQLVQVESPSHDAAALAESGAVLQDIFLRRLGSAPDLIASPVGPHVHWRSAGQPQVLLLGHHDTVFPLGTLSARPFAVSDRRITGPGVFDMLGGLVIGIHALATLPQLRGVEFLITADEEVGAGASRALLEERAAACGTVLVLEGAAPGGGVKTARKGCGGFTVSVAGTAAHAGLDPERGVNAAVEAAHLVAHITALGDPADGTTVTVTGVTAGTACNVVPAAANIIVDARITHLAEQHRIEHAMANLPQFLDGSQITVTGGFDRPPMTPESSAELFALAQTFDPTLEGMAVGGASDGNFVAACGVPVLDGLGAIGGGAHADHEYVEVDTLVPRAELVASLVKALSQPERS